MASKIRQNFHAECEDAINEQINLELHASYVYQSMSFHFDRDDIALPGFSHYFGEESKEEREHAEKLMKYLNKRGGKVVLKDVKCPEQDEWGNGLPALEAALEMEKKLNQSLLNIHALATKNNDPHLADFLESDYLNLQVESIKQYSEMITKLKRAGTDGLGLYLFDKDLKS